MLKNKLSQYLVFIALVTLLTLFAFLVEKSYSKLIGPIQKVQSDHLLKPIDPALDFVTIDEIEDRTNQPLIPDLLFSTPTPTI